MLILRLVAVVTLVSMLATCALLPGVDRVGAQELGPDATPEPPTAPADWEVEPVLLDAFGLRWEGYPDWTAPTDDLLAHDGTPAGVRLLKLVDNRLDGDFAAEVEMRGVPGQGGFGLLVTRSPTQSLRVGYAAGGLVLGDEPTASAGGFLPSARFIGKSWAIPWSPGTDWHIYRVEFRRVQGGTEVGDLYRFFVDSAPQQSTRYVDVPGPDGPPRTTRAGNHRLALWVDGTPLQVRAVRISAL